MGMNRETALSFVRSFDRGRSSSIHNTVTAQTLTMNCTHTKKDVKLMKKFISEEIMLSFPAPHKLDLSVRSDINESGDNEKGEIIEG